KSGQLEFTETTRQRRSPARPRAEFSRVRQNTQGAGAKPRGRAPCLDRGAPGQRGISHRPQSRVGWQGREDRGRFGGGSAGGGGISCSVEAALCEKSLAWRCSLHGRNLLKPNPICVVRANLSQGTEARRIAQFKRLDMAVRKIHRKCPFVTHRRKAHKGTA